MRKLFSIIIAAFLVFSLVACGSAYAFSWDQAKGTNLTVLLNQHTVTRAILGRVS